MPGIMRPRNLLILFGGLSLLAWAVVGVVEAPRELEGLRVERGEIERMIRVSGEVINERSLTLTALVDGQVMRIDAAMGERVNADQVLAAMDNRAAAARRQRAQAVVRREAVHLHQAELRLTRVRQLEAKAAAAEEQLEEARLERDAAQAAWQVARADLRLAEVAQEWQQVRAPFAALVVDKFTEVGQWVEAGTKLFSLVALEDWEIEAHVDAVDSGRLRIGQAVEVSCDAYPGRRWRSSIGWIGPSVEREQERRLNTFRVRLGLGENPPPLLLGQQVDLEILVERRSGVLTLPFAGLKERDGEYEAALIEAGRVRYRPVEIGLEGDSRVELLAGLAEGDRVIRLDGRSLEAGERVEWSGP